ncbi:MAG: hypothetical protein JRG93_11145 [Deltaproteobacteria bacterium]|nr:hypothetical protein [Deltaproteobacteria bacterium]
MPQRIKAIHFKPNHGQFEVWATLNNGKGQYLFRYYADELSFTEDEFIGLTYEEAENLRTKKDLAYLRS